ncbi:MAG: hypothetical protein P1P64_04985 [Treponemataceae bacterium]
MKKRIYGIVVFLAAISLFFGSCEQNTSEAQVDKASKNKLVIKLAYPLQTEVDVQVSDVPQLREPEAYVSGHADIKPVMEIRSFIGEDNEETVEKDWESAVEMGKIYVPNNKIIVTFTAKDSAGNKAEPLVVTYTVTADTGYTPPVDPEERPMIFVTQPNPLNQNVKVSDVKNLPEPQGRVEDNKDKDLKPTVKIESVISDTKTEESDWSTAISKTYAPKDKIIATFSAIDNDGNHALKQIVCYTVIPDQTSTDMVSLTCEGIESVTDCGHLISFCNASVTFDQFDNPTFEDGANYNLGDEITKDSWIGIKGTVKKGPSIDGEGSITFKCTKGNISDAREKAPGRYKNISHNFTSDNSRTIQGLAGTATSVKDVDFEIYIKVTESATLVISAKAPN